MRKKFDKATKIIENTKIFLIVNNATLFLEQIYKREVEKDV